MRLNTQLESEGAEFLVLGNLLIEGILSYKAYHNFKDYDLIAANPKTKKSVTIQVKSRYTTEWTGFIINNFESDFVILVILNRGYKKIKKNGETGVREPECFVFPIDYVKGIIVKSEWGKIPKSKMVGHSEYKNRWDLIKDALK